MASKLQKKVSYKLSPFEYRTDMDDTEHTNFPTSYPRRLPCEHWQRFPIKPHHDGSYIKPTTTYNNNNNNNNNNNVNNDKHLNHHQNQLPKKELEYFCKNCQAPKNNDYKIEDKNLQFQHEQNFYNFIHRHPKEMTSAPQ